MKNNVFWAFLAIIFIVGLTLGIAIYGSSMTGKSIFDVFSANSLNAKNQTNCTDSDGGINLPVKGTCKDGSGNKTDVCVNTTYLREYFCINATSCNWHVYNCAQFNYIGCYNGACTRNQTTAAGTSGGATPATAGVTPTTECTYQGVLDMLNACRLEVNNETNYTCNNFCQQKSKTCIQAYSYNKITQAAIPTSCSVKVGLSRILLCNCCSTSTSGGEVYGTGCTTDEDDAPYYPCRSPGSGNIPCTCPGGPVGGAAGMII